MSFFKHFLPKPEICHFLAHLNGHNPIGGVMVSVFASSDVDRGFEPQSGQTKD